MVSCQIVSTLPWFDLISYGYPDHKVTDRKTRICNMIKIFYNFRHAFNKTTYSSCRN